MMEMTELQAFLEEKVREYNRPEFIATDPIAIAHAFTLKEDVEIAGFLAATIAWGQRPTILKNAARMVEIMGQSPYDFVLSHDADDLERFDGFVHRTFNAEDARYFVVALRHLYEAHGGLEGIFTRHSTATDTQAAIHAFRTAFFSLPHPRRTEKHVADPLRGSSAKRLNMMLRWFCRQDSCGVDFGIWKGISPSALSIPLDVHTGNVARKLGLLQRRQNDAKAVAELDALLRQWDPVDPVKFDFALFGLGVEGLMR